MLRQIHAYRWVRRRLFGWIGPICPFTPTCSTYGLTAYGRHDFVRASALTAWRLLRCHPFTPGGFDPVPPRGDDRPDRPGTPPDPTVHVDFDDRMAAHAARGPR